MASLSDPLAQFQSIETPCVTTRPYRHIKPKAKFRELANNDSNVLAGSWLFHQFFDGLSTEDESGLSDIPLIALRPDPNKEPRDELVGEPPRKRARVSLLVECRPQAGETVGSLLKHGSERISENEWKTFIHVPDAKTCCECLQWKYTDT